MGGILINLILLKSTHLNHLQERNFFQWMSNKKINILKLLINKFNEVIYFTRSSCPFGFRKKTQNLITLEKNARKGSFSIPLSSFALLPKTILRFLLVFNVFSVNLVSLV